FIGDFGIAIIVGVFILFLFMYLGTDVMSVALIVTFIVTHHYSYIVGFSSLVRDRNILLLLALAVYAVDNYIRGRSDYVHRTPYTLRAVIIFIVAFTLWGIMNGNKGKFLRQDASWFLAILSYYPLARFFSKRSNIDLGINILLGFTSIMSVTAIYQFYRTNHRSISNAEMFIPIAIIIALELILHIKQALWRKILLLCILVLNSFGAFVSLTRSLWISLVFGIAFIVGLSFYKNRQKISAENARKIITYLCVILPLLFLMLYINTPLWNQVRARFKMIFMGGYDISTMYRLLEIKEMVQYIKGHLFIGDGMGAVVVMPFGLTTQIRISYGTPYLHNTLLYWILKFGLFFTIVWIAIWYKIIKELINKCVMETDTYLKEIKIGLLIGLFTITIFSMAAPVLSASTGMFFLGFVLAIFYPGKET
ncbi:MAG: O-antigen ligase family protein, partial [Mobilitalea sp.]